MVEVNTSSLTIMFVWLCQNKTHWILAFSPFFSFFSGLIIWETKAFFLSKHGNFAPTLHSQLSLLRSPSPNLFPLWTETQQLFLQRKYSPRPHTSALKPQDAFTVGLRPVSVYRTHTHTQQTNRTSSSRTECRCFGFSRVIAAVGSLKSLPAAVRGETSWSVSHIFYKRPGWKCIPHSSTNLPSIFFPPAHCECTDCKSWVCSIRVPLGGLRPALLQSLKSSLPETATGGGLSINLVPLQIHTHTHTQTHTHTTDTDKHTTQPLVTCVH